METETSKLREEMIKMLKDACFDFDKTDNNYTLKVLVYKEQGGGGDGLRSAESGDDASVDGESESGSDVESDDESDDDGPLSHVIDVGDVTFEDPLSYVELQDFELFKELCDIFSGTPQNLYSVAHFNYYNEHYDAHYETYKDHNNKLLDMYKAVDTMMLGLPYEEVTPR